MKGKSKTQKGITLVALIITIVVLIILAVVSVSGVINDGIFKKAEKSADTYNQSAEDEQDTLVGYTNDLNKYPIGSGDGEGSGSSTTTITFSINGIQFTADSGMTWGQWVNSAYNANISFATGGKLFIDNELVKATYEPGYGSTVIANKNNIGSSGYTSYYEIVWDSDTIVSRI